MAKPTSTLKPKNKGGRPKGFDKERARLKLRERVWAEMDGMIDAQIENAKGLKFLMVREKTGKFKRVAKDVAEKLNPGEEIIEVWEKDPSVYAFADLLDRTLDKAAQPKQEVDVKGDVTIKWQS